MEGEGAAEVVGELAVDETGVVFVEETGVPCVEGAGVVFPEAVGVVAAGVAVADFSGKAITNLLSLSTISSSYSSSRACSNPCGLRSTILTARTSLDISLNKDVTPKY